MKINKKTIGLDIATILSGALACNLLVLPLFELDDYTGDRWKFYLVAIVFGITHHLYEMSKTINNKKDKDGEGKY